MTRTWRDHIDAALALRHRLHRHPEPTWEETDTAATVREELDRAGITWRACAETGTVATLAPDAPGRHVALRADMDALPITEATGADWTSEREGTMHACGHDGHMATLFATAWWLAAHEDDLPGPVTLLFQPAEEGGHGAKRMIADGALDGVNVVFGWHNWPAIGAGRAVCPDGAVMAANGTFRIEVVGEGGHASQPESCRDPVLAASAITVAMQQVISRRVAPQDAAVVSITWIEAPSYDTVIPDRAVLGGSIRLADSDMRDQVTAAITAVAEDTARAYGVRAEVTHTPRYEATVNHPGPADEMRDAIGSVLGDGWQDTAALPVMASEDFSYYLAEIPGAFALVGGGDDDHDAPLHNARYDFNDALVERVARIYARLAGAPDPG